MPMQFPDLASLVYAAQVHGFRQPDVQESEDAYRAALADHVERIDFVESLEIRNKVGWDQFDEQQQRDMLVRRRLIARREERGG
jgi:hypothetical protein